MTAGPMIAELRLDADAERWSAAGFTVEFTVDAGSSIHVGTVALRLDADPDAAPGISAWTLRGPSPRGPSQQVDVDGLPTAWTSTDPAEPSEHANGITAIDHLVVLTPDLDSTIDALAMQGIELRRIREGPAGDGRPVRQAFFRMAEVILELVAVADGPTRFWGLTFVAADLDRTLEWFGDRVSEPRPAVQPGRRIATVRASAGLGLPVAVMDSAR